MNRKSNPRVGGLRHNFDHFVMLCSDRKTTQAQINAAYDAMYFSIKASERLARSTPVAASTTESDVGDAIAVLGFRGGHSPQPLRRDAPHAPNVVKFPVQLARSRRSRHPSHNPKPPKGAA